jgi:oligoendopeptidase F
MSGNKGLPKREELDSTYKWKLEDIYQELSIWEEDFKKVRELSDKISGYKGRLSDSSGTLLECFSLCDDMQMTYDKLFVFSRMKLDENNAESKYQSLSGRAMSLGTEIYARISFIVPEITAMPEARLKEFI